MKEVPNELLREFPTHIIINTAVTWEYRGAFTVQFESWFTLSSFPLFPGTSIDGVRSRYSVAAGRVTKPFAEHFIIAVGEEFISVYADAVCSIQDGNGEDICVTRAETEAET